MGSFSVYRKTFGRVRSNGIIFPNGNFRARLSKVLYERRYNYFPKKIWIYLQYRNGRHSTNIEFKLQNTTALFVDHEHNKYMTNIYIYDIKLLRFYVGLSPFRF